MEHSGGESPEKGFTAANSGGGLRIYVVTGDYGFAQWKPFWNGWTLPCRSERGSGSRSYGARDPPPVQEEMILLHESPPVSLSFCRIQCGISGG